MEYKKLIDNAPRICALTGTLLGGLTGIAGEIYISQHYGILPSAVLGGFAGATVGGIGGALIGDKIKQRLGGYKPSME